MDFSVSEEMQRMLRVVREFVREEVIPLERDFLSASFREMLPVLNEKRVKVKSMGLWLSQVEMEVKWGLNVTSLI